MRAGARRRKDVLEGAVGAQGATRLERAARIASSPKPVSKPTSKHEGRCGNVDMNDVDHDVDPARDRQRAGRTQDGLAFLATVGSTAPFVGLFGTVWGIYHALTAIGIAGQASIDKVAGPVGEALIMTAIGLAVAVPAVLGYNWLDPPQQGGDGARARLRRRPARGAAGGAGARSGADAAGASEAAAMAMNVGAGRRRRRGRSRRSTRRRWST